MAEHEQIVVMTLQRSTCGDASKSLTATAGRHDVNEILGCKMQ